MENLNAEQVKRALENWMKNYDGNVQDFTILCKALALINKQETEYNELYELCESYRIERDAMRGAANSYKLHYKTLEKENETLKNLLDESFEAQNTVKADTVREMQERFNEKVAKLLISPSIQYQASAFIDQIAKEMLEDAE